MAVLSNTGIRAGASGAGGDGYNLKRSTRFNDDDSAYLNRTHSVGNSRTFTWSGWVKLENSVEANIFCFGTSNSNDGALRIDNGQLVFQQYSSSAWQFQLKTNALYRDLSAWYHFVVAVDTTQATDTNRIKVYVNGSQITSWATSTWPSQNFSTLCNTAIPHFHGESPAYDYSSFYLADVHFVDGLQLDATSFAETDATTGQWVPKKYTHVASPNDGTTWSSNIVHTASGFQSGYGADKMFDGNVANYGQGNAGTNPSTLIFTPPTAISFTDKVEIWHIAGDSSITAGINSGTKSAITNGSWQTVASGGGTLTTLDISRSTNGGASLTGIRVDGRVLIDDAIDNSFHLAMDPAESGTIYSDGATSGGTLYSGSSWENVFNGETPSSLSDNSSAMSYSATGNCTLAIPPISGVIEVWASSASGSQTGTDSKIVLSDGSEVTVNVTASAPQWFSFGDKSNITSITINQSTNGVRLGAIKVGGKLLTDHTAIGNDSSGQNNDWHENNLVADAGKTYSTSNTWTASGNGYGNHPPSKVFDSDLTNYLNNSAGGQTITWDSSRFGLSGALRVYCEGPNYTVSVNGTDIGAAPNSPGWLDCGSHANINEIKFATSTGNAGIKLYQVEVGGSLLYDGVATPENQDLLADTPGAPYDNELNGGGNYATLNPLQNAAGNTFSNGNLQLNTNGSGWGPATSTIAMKTGKWYFEVECITAPSQTSFVGIVAADSTFALNTSLGHYPVCTAYQGNATKYTGGGTNTSYGATWGAGDIIGIAFDADNHTVTFYKNGTSQGAITSVPDDEYYFGVDAYHSAASYVFHTNFGARSFTFTPPTGYKALNAFSIPEPTIVKPSDHFDIATDTGANILSAATGLTDGADFVWIKDRANNSTNHILFNRINDTGMDGTPHLRSNEPDTEATCGTYSAPSGNSVAWVWNAGTATDTNNTAGEIIPTGVRANPSAGFSIVSYTGNSSSGALVGHGLNASPDFLIIKNRDSGVDWAIWHSGMGNSEIMRFDDRAPATPATAYFEPEYNTSSVFSLGTNDETNESGDDYIAYIWSEVAGVSKFGSYSGNASADGPFIYCGFKPALLIIKKTSATDGWMMYDNKRETTNLNDNRLEANSSADEYENAVVGLDFLSNGFKLRTADDDTNSGDYIFCAWAESPFTYSNAR